MLEIYGITGDKFHGKDTFSNFVKAFDNDFVILHFADRLRDICEDVFGITQDLMLNPGNKEKPFEVNINIDDYLGPLSKATGLNLKSLGLVADCPRTLLKYVGTDYVRSVRDSYWRDVIVSQIKDNSITKALISDTRFLNEADVLRQEFNAKIIRITRLDLPDSGDGHISEVESKMIREDLNVGVITGDLTVSEKIARCIAKGDWDVAVSLQS